MNIIAKIITGIGLQAIEKKKETKLLSKIFQHSAFSLPFPTT